MSAVARIAHPVSARYGLALGSLALILVVVAAFGGVAGHSFVGYDSGPYLTNNPRVLAGLTPESVRWAFLEAHAANWHPLTWLSHMLDVELFGLVPGWHLLENVAWHALNAVLLFALFQRTTGSVGRSFVVALLFALHPLHVESVAWVVERKDVLSTFFGLASLLAYCAWTKRGGALRYLAAFLTLALGLMAKPMLVTWPFLFLLFDVWPLGRTRLGVRRLALEKLPFLVLAIASSALTVWAQSAGRAIQELGTLPFEYRVGNALAAYVEYLRQTVLPVDLAFFYPHPYERPGPVVARAATLLLAISGVAWFARRRSPWLFVGWSWFLGTLVPVIGLLQVGGQARADRYTYVPLIGLFAALVWEAAERLHRARAPRWVAPLATLALGVVLGGLTRRQVATWRDDESLFRQALAVTENNHVAHNLYGQSLVERGELDSGIAQFEAALAISPRDPDSLDNHSVALLKVGRVGEAEAAARRAVELAPWRVSSHAHLGAALQMQQRYVEAYREFAEALRLEPDHIGAATNLALVLERLGRFTEAIRSFEHALSLAPAYAPARLSLARLLLRNGDLDWAERELRQALAYDPESVEALRGLALVESARGRHREALAALEQVLAARPDSAAALGDAAWLLATTKDAEVFDAARALALAERAVELTGRGQPGLLDVLAAANAASRYFLDAVATGTEAAELARRLGDADLAARIDARVTGYRTGQRASGER